MKNRSAEKVAAKDPALTFSDRSAETNHIKGYIASARHYLGGLIRTTACLVTAS